MINTSSLNKLYVTCSLDVYNTSDIKRALDTKITELSIDGYYDYLSTPTYDVELPADSGPFWKRDKMTIKWDYSEPLNDLIPSTSIYLVSESGQKLIRRNIKTSAKNINYTLPDSLSENSNYHFKVGTIFEGEEIFDTSSLFTVKRRFIDITTGAPTSPIVANQGNTFTVDWNGEGISDYVKIELLQSLEWNTITIDGNIGRLIGDAGAEPPIALNGDPSNPVVIKTLEAKKYVGNNKSYTWTVNDISHEIENVRLKVIDSYHPYAYDYTPPINLTVKHIALKNMMGRLIGQPAIGEVTYSGISDALLSVHSFIPKDRIVPESQSLQFIYNTTNAIQVYLTKQSKPNYSLILPSLNGTHTIQNIVEDDVYTVNAKDSLNRVRKATFGVYSELEGTTNETELSKFTLVQLLNYSVALGEESLTAGDVILEPGAPIPAKVAQYKVEASQMSENTDYTVVKFLLKLVNDDILSILLIGQNEPPRILLGDGSLRERIMEANVEIAKRLNEIPVTKYKVSGYITTASIGIPEVNVYFTNNGGTTVTNTFGYYEKELPALYTGVATPNHSSYNFIPVNLQYNGLNSNKTNQNYVAQRRIQPLVLKIITKTLPTASLGQSYEAQLQASNGVTPYTWSRAGGHLLPPDLTLVNSGIISGIINSNASLGEYVTEYRVTDAVGNTATKTLTIKVIAGA